MLSEWKGDVFKHGHRVEQGPLLKEKAYSLSDCKQAPFRQCIDAFLIEGHGPFVGSEQTDHQLEHDALASAARPEDDRRVSLGEGEVKVIEDRWPAEGLAHPIEADERGGWWFEFGASCHGEAPYHPQTVQTRPISRESLLEGRIFAVERCSWETEAGVPVTREVVRHPGAVTIVPWVDPEHLVLVRNWRIAVGGPLWEFPAGKLESDEPPARAAHRELAEETGYAAARIEARGCFYTSPGFADERMHVFEATGLTAGAAHPEAGEEVEPRVFAVGDLHAMIAGGELVDGKSLGALMLCQFGGAPDGVC